MPAVSKAQQRLLGMVHACQKGEKCSSKKVKEIAKSMKPQDTEDFAATKHKNLPERKKKKHKSFEEWLMDRDPQLYEVATTTSCIAPFMRPIGDGEPVRRKWPKQIVKDVN